MAVYVILLNLVLRAIVLSVPLFKVTQHHLPHETDPTQVHTCLLSTAIFCRYWVLSNTLASRTVTQIPAYTVLQYPASSPCCNNLQLHTPQSEMDPCTADGALSAVCARTECLQGWLIQAANRPQCCNIEAVVHWVIKAVGPTDPRDLERVDWSDSGSARRRVINGRSTGYICFNLDLFFLNWVVLGKIHRWWCFFSGSPDETVSDSLHACEHWI